MSKKKRDVFSTKLKKDKPTLWDKIMPRWAHGLLAAKAVDEKDLDVGQKSKTVS